VDLDPKQVALGIDHDVALATTHLFSPHRSRGRLQLQ
jgi:hypothetical protein